MSGIYCVYHRDRAPLPASILADMGRAMDHRGPDGIRTWHDENSGLGFCCLDSTPRSGAEQLPFPDDASGLVITADARLDNREELLSRLAGPGDGQRPVPDCRLILEAYRKWGTRCVDYLLGDYAFVIRDRKQQQVFCARDHLGIKPFYYHLSCDVFAGASEAGSLLRHPQVPSNINEARIADFLVSQLEGVDKTSTFYTSIQRLPPAHALLVNPDRVLITEYWKLNPYRETRYKRDAEYTEAFQEILSSAVRARLRCVRRPAMLLSGGIDSAAVAAFGIQPEEDRDNFALTCYSAIAENPAACRESQFINKVCLHLHATSNFVTPRVLRTYKEKLHALFASLEEPFDDMILVVLLYLSAKDNQHDVVLDGVEGDMVYSLADVYPGLLLKQGSILSGMSEIYGYRKHRYNGQYPWYQTLNDTVRPVLVPGWLRNLRRRLSGRSLRNNAFSETGINPDLAARVHLPDRLKRLYEYGQAGNCKTLRELHIQNITHPYLANALERYDRLAALCRVEPRHPLLDKRLVEFSCSLPWNQKVRHGWSKYMLRLACQARLPADVVWRKDWENLGWTYTSTWIKENREHIIGRISNVMPHLEKYMNATSVKNILGGEWDDDRDDEKPLVWSIFLLASWLQSRTGFH